LCVLALFKMADHFLDEGPAEWVLAPECLLGSFEVSQTYRKHLPHLGDIVRMVLEPKRILQTEQLHLIVVYRCGLGSGSG
jgi:hypothetical protein